MTMLHKTAWFLPLFSVALGLAFLAALWAGGNPTDGAGVAYIVALGFLRWRS